MYLRLQFIEDIVFLLTLPFFLLSLTLDRGRGHLPLCLPLAYSVQEAHGYFFLQRR